MNDDLNEGAGSEYLWMGVSRDAAKVAPIIDASINEGLNPPDYVGLEVVCYYGTDNPANFNLGAGGAYLYMFVKRDYSAKSSIFAKSSTWLLIGGSVVFATGAVTAAIVVNKHKKQEHHSEI